MAFEEGSRENTVSLIPETSSAIMFLVAGALATAALSRTFSTTFGQK